MTLLEDAPLRSGGPEKQLLDVNNLTVETLPDGSEGNEGRASDGGRTMGGVPKLRADALPDSAQPIFDAYLRYLDRRDFSDLTRKHYRVTAWHWLQHHGTSQPDHVDVEDFVDGCASTYTRVRSFVRWACAEGHYETDPLLRATPPRSKRGVPRPISEHDFARALAAADPEMRSWILLAGKAALRCKEIAGIKTEDLDLNSETPMVYVSNPKGSSYGHVPLHPDIIDALEALRLPASGYLFPGSAGRAFVHPSTVSAKGNRHFDSLGIDATMHQLRHRCLSKIYDESGGDLLLTQRVARHASVQSTQIYAERDVMRMAGLFGSL